MGFCVLGGKNWFIDMENYFSARAKNLHLQSKLNLTIEHLTRFAQELRVGAHLPGGKADAALEAEAHATECDILRHAAELALYARERESRRMVRMMNEHYPGFDPEDVCFAPLRSKYTPESVESRGLGTWPFA